MQRKNKENSQNIWRYQKKHISLQTITITKPDIKSMRKSGISLLLMLFAVAGWAQESKTKLTQVRSERKWVLESKPEKKESLSPIIIEGTLEGVPEGTVIAMTERVGGTMIFLGKQTESQDTVKNGKFRIAYKPQSKSDEFMIRALNSHSSLRFYASPGTTTTITGNGAEEVTWYVKNDNPKQKEENEYRAYMDEKLPDYYDLRDRYMKISKDDKDYYTVKKKARENDSLYVEYMVEFMQNREYSSVYANKLFAISRLQLYLKNKSLREKVAKLLAKVPKDEEKNNQLIIDAKKDLLPKYEPIKIGEKLHDFVLYDHQDKEHHLTEFNGNGKYLLLEFNSRTCVGCMERRQYDALNALYKNHSDKVDMLMVNCDAKYYWDIECKDPNKYGRDPWNEWNDKKDAEDIMQRYGAETGPCYFFVDKDGTILGRISDQGNLQEAIDKYFKL